MEKIKWTTEIFIEKAKEIHGDTYDYSKTEYINSRTKVCIICHEKDKNGVELGEYWIYPLNHLKGQGNPRRIRGVNEELWEERTCPICGKIFKVRKKCKKINCSEECRKQYYEIHKEEINKKKSLSLKESYKKKTPEQIKKEHEKAKQTSLLRYGETSFSKTEKGRKISSMNMKKFKKDFDKKYREEILIPKYTEICEKDNLELLEFRDRFNCLVRCKKCGNEFVCKTLGYLTEETTTKRCRVCYPLDTFLLTTKFEEEFEYWVKSLKIKYIKNYRSLIYPYEIDFYFPDYKIGVELDGLYWHSEIHKDDKYHLMKTEKCESRGVQLIHIIEDEWLYKRDICISRLKSLFKISENKVGARNCEIKLVPKEIEKEFLEKNHIQGYTPSKYAYGLYYNDILVSIMSFGKYRKNMGRKTVDNEFELLRYCNKLDFNVIGGANKLLKYFIKEISPIKIISYADRRWSIGNVYEKMGFTFIKNTTPNYFYIFGTHRKNRFGFRKNILVEKYGCPPDITEKEFCFNQKWYRIYDCGNKLYEIVITPEGASFE